MPHLARELGSSARSLQRRLAAEQSSFSSLLAEARLAQAAKLLGTTACTPAKIGVCAFSDQAHFTRDFERFTALTPLGFREQFARERMRA